VCRAWNGWGAGGEDASRPVFFLAIIAIFKGWSGLALSLTCRQGDFADDLSEEGMRAQASGIG
jgi:hypothetical protein